MLCGACKANQMHISKFRRSDLIGLLFLGYPVRCHYCNQRGYASLLDAWRVHSEEKALKAKRAAAKLAAEVEANGVKQS